jgi:plastocyanin
MTLHTEEPKLTVPDVIPNDTVVERAQARFEWTIVAIGLTALTAVIALVVAFSALGQNATRTTVTRTIYRGAAPAAAQTPAVAPQSVTMAYRSDVEHGKRGPDGTWHDAATNANFTVHAGAQMTVTAINYDTSPHSFTAPGLGVDQIIPGGGPNAPTTTKFTFKAPSKPGLYKWHCKVPCDHFAMMHIGYMEGNVKVVA